MNQLTLSQTIEGYELYARARKLSTHTIADYLNTYRKFANHLQIDPPLASITPNQVQTFLASQPVSAKTCLNYHTGLSALWTWAVDQNLTPTHILQRVDRPRPEKRAINPYTRDDLRAMLTAVQKSKTYTRLGQRPMAHTIPNHERYHAILLLLLDTGMRAEELCTLRLHQLDIKNHRVKVFGKGAKERILPFSPATAQSLWRYLTTREDPAAGDPLFITSNQTPFNRKHLHHRIKAIGERAGITDPTVHRFRHTFAINYLRNGGDPYTLQILLGHTTMEMVRTYLRIAQTDIEARHKLASPVAMWNLK